MAKKLREPAHELDITDGCEILVAGGGIAGIAAALAAARNGARVLLIEREWMLGGLATLGLVTLYLPLCDGKGRQVVYGIGEELLKLSIKYGAEEGDFPFPRPWLEGGTFEEKQKVRYRVQYHPFLFAICAERLLSDAGVELLYGPSASAVLLKDRRIEAVIIENKSGRSAITVNAVIDATGDADIYRQSGAKTYQFSQGNVLASWHYAFSEGKIQLRMAGYADVVKPQSESKHSPEDESSEDGEKVLSKRRFTGLDGKELSEMAEDSHKALLNIVERERLSHPDYYPVATPVI
ncbi:MAG: FAD-dependent oxidoreductase, partial [Treponema sp.]|nr:FAD-dependent oxidoreductase [Treponema sp.]